MKIPRLFVSGLITLFVIGMIFVALPVSNVLADTAGPNNAGAGASVAGIDTSPWINPNNITPPVGLDPTTSLLKKGSLVSDYLWATEYGFDIPSDATITGIEVVINRQSSGNNPSIADNVVSLVSTVGLIGENRAYTTTWPTSMMTATYGSPTDLWGLTNLTPAVINSIDFGVALSAQRLNNGNSDRTASVDYIQITVYYMFRSSTTVNCSDSVFYGGTITCTATITRLSGSLTPTGSVEWSTDSSGTFDPPSCVLSGTGASASCSTSYTPTAVGDGSHLITGNYSGDVYFSPNHAHDTVAVSQRPVTVTADAKTKVYHQPDPAFTYHITAGSLVFTDTFTGTLTREPGEGVGMYPILQGTLALSANYVLTYVGADLTIQPIAITVTADPKSKQSGQPDPPLTYKITSGVLLAGDAFTGQLVRTSGEDIGTYPILQGTLGLPDYYELTFIGANFTIQGYEYWLPVIYK